MASAEAAPRRTKRRRERSASDQRTGVDYPRWYWPSFTASGPHLADRPVRPAVLRRRLGRVRHGRPVLPDAAPRLPAVVVELQHVHRDAAEVLRRRRSTSIRLIRTLALRGRRERDLPGDRLRGRVLHRAVRREAQGPDPGAAGRAVLDQLPDADLRVAEPAAARRLHQRLPAGSSGSHRSTGWPANRSP